MVQNGSPPSPRRALILVGALILLVLPPLGPCLYLKWVENRRWGEMKAECEAIARRARARDPVRPVLRGTPEPGNAWDDYAAAQSAARNLGGHHAGDYLYDQPRADKFNAEADVARFATAIRALRNGTRKGMIRRSADWESGFPRVMYSGYLATAAACQSRLLAEEGRSEEAAELALDLAEYGLDLARGGDLIDLAIGVNAVDKSLEVLRRQLNSSPMSREDLLEMSRELGVLDGNFPNRGESEVLDAVRTGLDFLASGDVHTYLERGGWSKQQQIPTWKYAFSDRLLMADAFREMLSAARRKAEVEGHPWSKFWPVRLAIERELETSRNPLTSYIHNYVGVRNPAPRDAVRECRVQLRLVMVAAQWLAAGEIQDIEDPFGTTLQHRQEGNRLRVWSVGRDGVDDSGIGEWDPSKGKDIVFQVSK